MSLLSRPLRVGGRALGHARPQPSLRSARVQRYATQAEPKDTTTRNAVVASLLLVAAAGIYYWESKQMGIIPSRKDEFTLTVGRGSNRHTETFERKTLAQQEEMLHVNEKTVAPNRAGNPVVRWDTNFVPSNEPCEDRSAADVIPRGPQPKSWWSGSSATGPEGKRDIVLVSVIDGHAGDATSALLSRTLHPTVTLGLAALQAGIVPGQGWYTKLMDKLTMASHWTPSNIAGSITSSFTSLDDHITDAPIAMLPQLVNDRSPEMVDKFITTAAPAVAGAVAGTMLVDAENDGLYVAVVGDCRAVAGWQAADGSWRCDTLSEDAMGDNPKEVARMRSEHPASEADTVIFRGRVMGGLQPTRAFGDAVYKWNTAQGEAIDAIFRDAEKKGRRPPAYSFTPPYVTARPEITYRQLKGKDGEQLKFVVLATDGLWDAMTSEEATLLMAGYLKHPKREDVARTALVEQIPVATTEPRPYPVDDLPGQGKRAAGHWCFEGDDNAATHLIRNALGGGDRKHRGELLSLHGKTARWYRDDMTVSVVFLDSDKA